MWYVFYAFLLSLTYPERVMYTHLELGSIHMVMGVTFTEMLQNTNVLLYTLVTRYISMGWNNEWRKNQQLCGNDRKSDNDFSLSLLFIIIIIGISFIKQRKKININLYLLPIGI